MASANEDTTSVQAMGIRRFMTELVGEFSAQAYCDQLSATPPTMWGRTGGLGQERTGIDGCTRDGRMHDSIVQRGVAPPDRGRCDSSKVARKMMRSANR